MKKEQKEQLLEIIAKRLYFGRGELKRISDILGVSLRATKKVIKEQC